MNCFVFLFVLKFHSDQKVADQNALLVLENVKVKGFKIGDRANGFNRDDTEIILEVCTKYIF